MFTISFASAGFPFSRHKVDHKGILGAARGGLDGVRGHGEVFRGGDADQIDIAVRAHRQAANEVIASTAPVGGIQER